MCTFSRAFSALMFTFLTSIGVAKADNWEIGNYPTKISIVVDTSNSMLGVDGSTLTQKSVLVRGELARTTGNMIGSAAMDLWHFGGRANEKCMPELVYGAAKSDTGIVEAVLSLKQLQASSMLAMSDAKNPIAKSLEAAKTTGSQGIFLVTDSAEDCTYSPKAVCEMAGTLNIPVYVLSLSVTRQGRADLECLANVSHGAFAHASTGQEIAPLMKTLMSVAVSRAQMSVAEKIILELVRKNTELHEYNNALAASNTALERENASLEEQVVGLKARIEMLDEELANRDAIIASQQESIAELHGALESLTAENADLRVVISAVKQEVADQKIIIGDLKAMVEHLESELAQKDTVIAALHEELKKLIAANGALREELAKLKADLVAANEEIGVLNEHLVRQIAERDEVKIKLTERVQEVADLQVELEACKQAKQATSDTIEDQLIIISELEQTVITATANCEGRVQSVQATEWAQCDAKIGLIQTGCAEEKAALKAHIGKLNELITQKDRAIVGLHDEIEGWQAKLEQKNAEIKVQGEKIVGQATKIDGLVYENAELNKTINGLQHSIKDLSVSLKECEKRLSQCTVDKGDLARQVQAQMAEIKALQLELDESQTLLQICEGELGQAIIEKNRVQYFIDLSNKLQSELEMTRQQLLACEADKAAFKNGLNPLVDDHLEVPSDTRK